MYPKHDEDPTQLLRCADDAMYAAKDGPVCWSLYEPSMKPGRGPSS
jgi:GGDEF domain-containing protein